jgi:hypothetical protein
MQADPLLNTWGGGVIMILIRCQVELMAAQYDAHAAAEALAAAQERASDLEHHLQVGHAARSGSCQPGSRAGSAAWSDRIPPVCGCK